MSCNVVNEYIKLTEKNIKKYFNLILGKKFDAEIFSSLFKEYVNVRYFNLYERVSKNNENNINFYVKKETLKLIENNYDVNIVKETFGLFRFVLYFDDVKKVTSWSKVLEEIFEYSGYNDYNDELLNMVKEDIKIKKEYMSLFTNNDFNLKFKKTSKAKLQDVSIDFNIKFPKLYSDYAINKVFDSNIIAEDKMFVEYYLISVLILKKIISMEFNFQYLIDFDLTIYEKKNKCSWLINIISNDALKEHVAFKIKYSTYLENKNIINNLIRNGFNFGIALDKTYNLDPLLDNTLVLFKYIITESKEKYQNNAKFVVL